jgi:uncharacterized protein
MPRMLKKSLLAALVLGTALAAHAQTPAAAPAAAAAPSSPAKKELVARILKHQQAAVEGIARSLVEQPAMDLMQDVSRALPARVPKDKQEAMVKDIQADVKKYLDDAVPYVQGRALKIAPTTIGTSLEERFTEDELRQLIGILESPVFTKYQQMGDDLRKQFADKLVADTRSTIEPKVHAMEESVAKRLGVTATPAAGAPAARPAPRPARPASK